MDSLSLPSRKGMASRKAAVRCSLSQSLECWLPRGNATEPTRINHTTNPVFERTGQELGFSSGNGRPGITLKAMKTLSFFQRLVSFAACMLVASISFAQGYPTGSPLDWTRLPGKYTHSENGQRIDQFATPTAPLSNERADFQRSGYRHYRSTLQAGTSADNLHIVEEWGNPVRPYDEWRFPFRPFSAPYPAWGPQPVPFGGVGNNFVNPYGPAANGGQFFGANPQAFPRGFVPAPVGPNGQMGWGQAVPPPNGFPNNPGPNANPNPPNANPNPWSNPNYQPNISQPWMNGYWPNVDEIPQPRDEDFFRRAQP